MRGDPIEPTQAREHTERWAAEIEWPLVRDHEVAGTILFCIVLRAHAGK